MRKLKFKHSILTIGLLVVIFSVACTPQSSTDQPDTTSAESSEESAGAGENSTEQEPAADADNEESSGADSPAEAEIEQGDEEALVWTKTPVGEGIKPALAIDAAGNAHLAFLTEADHGTVFYATNREGSFETDTVAEGYFYGPVDIALSFDGVPYIAYHDHQETDFNPRKGDEVVAISNNDAWELFTVSHSGHDGWDNSIVVDSDGNWHTAAVDPAQFGSTDGVEYATNLGDAVNVSSVNSGPVVYEFGTSIALDDAGLPAISYYDDSAQQLVYASLTVGEWSLETVDDDGDAGRFSSLVFDGQGNPHISYYTATSDSTGTVKHAWRDGSSWQIEDVDVLDNVQMGHTGARKITSLAIGPDGAVHIAYADRGRVAYGVLGDSGWSLQDVEVDSTASLGQLVELALDRDGKPSLTWFEVTSPSPLNGRIIFATGS